MTGAMPPENEVFDVTFQPMMLVPLLEWLHQHEWTLIEAPITGPRLPSFIAMHEPSPPPWPSNAHMPSQVCPICGTPLNHEKCSVCAEPHEYREPAREKPYGWCDICGLADDDSRAAHITF